MTGELPKYIQETPQLKLNSQEPSGEGEIPVCKDFLKRECQRGKKCKFLHVNEPRGTIKNRTEDFEIPEAKRRNLDEADGNYWSFTAQHLGLGANFTESTIASPVSFHPAVNKPVYAVHGNGSSYYDVNMLQEENMLLRKKVEDLKKQVTELMATNEFLLDQNAHYRIQGKYSSSATNLTTVSLPAVSIASSVSSCNLAVPVTSSITAFGALGPLSSVQTVQALATLPLVTAQSTSNISTSIPYATSVSLAQPAPLATVSLTPVTLNQTTPLASQNPALSAATATVTLTPTINGAAALQLQGTNSTLTFSGAEGSSLVSYPIMTQSLIASSGLPNSL